MKKETIYLLIVIIIVLIIGSMVFTYIISPKHQEIQIGDSKFAKPDGYHEDKHSDNGVTITNGQILINILQYNDVDLYSHIQEYDNELAYKNLSNSYQNFTIDNITIFKSTNNNMSNVVYYWFVKDNKGYSISTGDYNSDIEPVITGIINSLTPA